MAGVGRVFGRHWLWRLFGGEVDEHGDIVLGEDDWLVVLRTRQVARARAALSALDAHSIEARANATVESRRGGYQRWGLPTWTTVYVRAPDEDRAREIIDRHERLRPPRQRRPPASGG
jgi:hypothetical protein